MNLIRELVFRHNETRVTYPIGTPVHPITGNDEESLYCKSRASQMSRHGNDMIACVIDGRARIIEKNDAK